MSKKVVFITPIPIEFNAAKEIFGLSESKTVNGCRLCMIEKHGLCIYCLLSGPGKTRSAQATTAFIERYAPSLVIDTGTCAGLSPVIAIGDVIISYRCFEFDIGGQRFPTRKIKEMELESGFRFLSESVREVLICRAGVCAQKCNMRLIEATQAAGEILINSGELKNKLFELFQTAGGNWETAAVFLSSLRASLPALSLRIVSDLGETAAVKEFRSHAKSVARRLFQFIDALCSDGWFGKLLEEWMNVKDTVIERLPRSVLP